MNINGNRYSLGVVALGLVIGILYNCSGTAKASSWIGRIQPKTNAPPVVVPVVSNVPPPAPPVVVVSNIPPAPMPEVATDATDAAKIKTLKGNEAAKAKIANCITSARFAGDKIIWRGDNRPKYWPQRHGKKDTDGQAYLFFVRDGVVMGGEFDATGLGQFNKGLENLTVGEGKRGRWDGIEPSRGDACYFCVISWDGKERSNIVKTQNGYREK